VAQVTRGNKGGKEGKPNSNLKKKERKNEEKQKKKWGGNMKYGFGSVGAALL
jgi:hypothetical protein